MQAVGAALAWALIFPVENLGCWAKMPTKARGESLRRKGIHMAKQETGVVKTGKAISPAQEALQVTFVLKGNLKRAQLMYLFIAKGLANVRDRSLYAALGHKDMEDYAHQRLDLGRSSLFNYLRIYDWVSKSHPEWLGKNVKGRIPDLTDVGDLMWIEGALQHTELAPAKRTLLEGLRKKAVAGTLLQSELKTFRESEKPAKDLFVGFLTALRGVHKKAAGIAGMPPEVVSHLEAAINLIGNEKALKVAGLRMTSAGSYTVRTEASPLQSA
jgi:hypothetical protein